MNNKLQKTVFTALFMALCCVGTLIYIPSPASNGYLNMGDCFVILSGWFLGPVYGFLAGGIGSAISDLLLGYASYAPATFLIKGIMALVCFYMIKALSKAFCGKRISLLRIASALVSETIMVSGYFLYDALLMKSFISPLSGIPGNAIQGFFGITASVILAGVFEKTGLKNRLFK